MKVEFLEEVGSTNEYIKKYACGGEDVFVFAERQSAGRGTKGRSFSSRTGGVYCSALRFYQNVPAERAFCVMTHAAVSVCRTLEHFGARPEIKWPNDILADGKKICGILIENVFKEGKLFSAVVGMGINITNDVSEVECAVRLCDLVERTPSVPEARRVLMEKYLEESTMEDYLARVRFLGKKITCSEGGRTFSAIAAAILPDGRLRVEEDGKRRDLSSAEIKIGG